MAHVSTLCAHILNLLRGVSSVMGSLYGPVPTKFTAATSNGVGSG